ncbi:MAG: LysR substrate-binding domain-containing protein [Xylophilus ampelinus]
MDFKQLEYFVRVAESRSFTRASIALDVAQPALSRQVRQLEVELRQNLLVRNGRGVVLTEAGERFLGHARGILHQVEHALEAMDRSRGSLGGRVAIGLPPSLGKRMTVPLSRAFRQRLPDATLSITEALSTAMQDALAAGRLDIALLYNPCATNEIDSIVIQEEELFLVGRAGTERRAPLPLVELADVPLVIPTRPNAIRTIVDLELANLGRRATIAMEIDGVAAILALVGDGAGHAVLPMNAILTASNADAFTASRIVEPTLRSRLALATGFQRPVTPTQAAAAGLIRELLAQAGAGETTGATVSGCPPAGSPPTTA